MLTMSLGCFVDTESKHSAISFPFPFSGATFLFEFHVFYFFLCFNTYDISVYVCVHMHVYLCVFSQIIFWTKTEQIQKHDVLNGKKE